MKKLSYGAAGRAQLMAGVDALADAVQVTLGAKGRNVILVNWQRDGSHITKDGVTVAKSVEFPGFVKNAGAMMVKDVAIRAAEQAGDGTTTATVLARSIIKQGMAAIDAGANPMDIKKGIDAAVLEVVKYIKEVSKQVKTDQEQVKQVATISANGDTEIGEIIAKAFAMVGGNDGEIIVENSPTVHTTLEHVNGFRFDRGFISPHFINTKGKLKCELVNPVILFFDKHIMAIREIFNILEKVIKANRSLLIVCDDCTDEALKTLIMNKHEGRIKICIVQMPEFGVRRAKVVGDMATLTGGRFFNEATGKAIKDITLEDLGSCEKIVVDQNKTIIIGAKAKDKAEALAAEIKSQIDDAEDEHEKEFLRSHLAKVNNGVAILRVGGYSEVEIKEKKDRIDDSLCATSSALEEGIIAGGGSTYIKAIDKLLMIQHPNKDINTGYNIVKKAIAEPFHQILKNAGIEEPERKTVYESIVSGDYGIGYNVVSEKVENLLKTGVIDTAKVARVALESAGSIGGTFITTECVIAPFVPKGSTKHAK